MSDHHIHCSNPACPALIAEDLDLHAGPVAGLERQVVAGRIRTSQRLAASRALKGLSRRMLRDIGIDFGAA